MRTTAVALTATVSSMYYRVPWWFSLIGIGGGAAADGYLITDSGDRLVTDSGAGLTFDE